MAVDFSSLPNAESCRRVDFDKAEVIVGFVSDGYVLVVSGMKDWTNVAVRLIPLTYSKQPDYWEIEVVGHIAGFGLPAQAPFHESLPLDGIRGKKGIEVVGATKRLRIDVP